MKIYLFILIVMLSMLSGCASTGTQQVKVERITPEELAKLMPPPVATVTLDEIVADSKAGKTTDEIINKIKTSNSRYELTSTQVLDLNKQGVDAKVLDYIGQANESAKQNAIADEINKREKDKRAAQQALRREREFSRNQFYDPFWGPGFGGFYGRPWIGPIGPRAQLWRGNRFGWGMGFGNPYWGW
jgi:PBP1b-binding outer membrane lipoprotein LpoB